MFSSSSAIAYSQDTLKRAERALVCSPFSLKLWLDLKNQSVPLPQIAGQKGLQRGYLRGFLTENQVERELMWLIQVGLLRREVDGQGITDSFRLTPIGRQILTQYEVKDCSLPQATPAIRLQNFLTRLHLF